MRACIHACAWDGVHVGVTAFLYLVFVSCKQTPELGSTIEIQTKLHFSIFVLHYMQNQKEYYNYIL